MTATFIGREREELIEFELVFIDLLGLLESEAIPLSQQSLQLVNIILGGCWCTFSSFLAETIILSSFSSINFVPLRNDCY